MNGRAHPAAALEAALASVRHAADREAIWTGHLNVLGLPHDSTPIPWTAEIEDARECPAPLKHGSAPLIPARVARRANEILKKRPERDERSSLQFRSVRSLSYELYGTLLSHGLPAHHLTFAAARLAAHDELRSRAQRETLELFRAAPAFPATVASAAQLRGIWKRLNGHLPPDALQRQHLTASLTARSAVQATRAGMPSEVNLYAVRRDAVKGRTTLRTEDTTPFPLACLNTDRHFAELAHLTGVTLVYVIQNGAVISEIGGYLP